MFLLSFPLDITYHRYSQIILIDDSARKMTLMAGLVLVLLLVWASMLMSVMVRVLVSMPVLVMVMVMAMVAGCYAADGVGGP